MSKLKLVAFAACLAFAIAPMGTSLAGAPDYSKKKSGGVSFSNDKEETTAATSGTEATDPSQIEPAAGGYEEEDEAQEKSLADDMKLPRK